MLRGVIVLIVVASSALGACGPIGYINEVTRRASTTIDQARAVEADRYAPYHWTRATQYLTAAREAAARADFQGANRYGRLARESAELAVDASTLAMKDPSKRPFENKPAPAKDDDAPPAKVKPAPAKDEP